MIDLVAVLALFALHALPPLVRRRWPSLERTAGFHRRRWRKLAPELGLSETRVPHEFAASRGHVTVVLNAGCADLRVHLRALGVNAPAKLLRALRADARFASWQHTIVNGEVHARVPCDHTGPKREDVAAWLSAASAPTPVGSVYRSS